MSGFITSLVIAVPLCFVGVMIIVKLLKVLERYGLR